MARLTRLIVLSIARIAAHGTGGYPPAVARRLRIINITALASIVIVICYSLTIIIVDFSGLKTILPQNALFALVCAVTPALHRFGFYTSGAVFILAAYSQLFAITYLLGTGSGQHHYYFFIAAITFLRRKHGVGREEQRGGKYHSTQGQEDVFQPEEEKGNSGDKKIVIVLPRAGAHRPRRRRRTCARR